MKEGNLYLYNGCSGHMTSDQSCLINMKPYINQSVTFEDGEKDNVKLFKWKVYHNLRILFSLTSPSYVLEITM